MDVWTRVPKPSESSVTSSVTVLTQSAQPFGLMLSITSLLASGIPTTSVTGSSIVTGWTGITKPTSSTWTYVIKPTS